MAVSRNGFARTAGAVAVATAASRATGFIRTLALAAVLGTAVVGDAYNGANSMPNMVYELLLGGVMSSVLIPVLARARLRGRTYSRIFTQRLLLATVLGAAVITAIAVACAPLLVAALVSDAEQSQLATVLAYLLLPEIFFYAIAATATAVLNVRESYAPAAWASVVNNLIVLAMVVVFAAVPGPVTLLPSTMTAAQVLVLGIGTTIGIVGQAVWTVAALRRTGFRWSWRVRPVPYTWRPVRVGARVLGWVLLYVAISQVGVAVVLRVAFSHGGVSTYTYADLLFQVPYGILGVSLLTVLMPRISRAVALGDRDALVADMGRAARYSVVALVPAAVAMTLLGPILTTVMFVGRVDVDAARTIGVALALSAFGLPPFALVMLQLRVFYAGNDMRTPVDQRRNGGHKGLRRCTGCRMPAEPGDRGDAAGRKFTVVYRRRHQWASRVAPPLRPTWLPHGARNILEGAVGLDSRRRRLRHHSLGLAPGDRQPTRCRSNSTGRCTRPRNADIPCHSQEDRYPRSPQRQGPAQSLRRQRPHPPN
ncbi:murein biosynthesis integral membrane protein MurJ [Rhodococcus sp. 24CO]|uniref:murein biosynthesis integral membrane protein MurJ n=1 Tax=Rhodococcus sp. 24CO TaxID=3117460 RepID=UPI003D354C71